MHVAVVTTSFPVKPGEVSGVFVRRLVENLPQSFRVTVITPCPSYPVNSDPRAGFELKCFRYAPRRWQKLAHEPGGIPVALSNHRAWSLLVPLFLGSMFWACLRVCRDAEVIHANWSINGVVAGLAGLVSKTPLVTTVRGEDVNRAKVSRIYRWMLGLCLRWSYRVLTVSEAIHEMLAKTFPEHAPKLLTVANGVEVELLSLPRQEDKDDDPEVFRLVTIGSLIPRKGINLIIESLAAVGPQVHLTVIGDGPERTRLKDLVLTRGGESRVHWQGRVRPQEVLDYLTQADGFVLASHSEGRPNVVLEALATGVPVIASDIDGVRELIQDNVNGLLFRPGDTASMVEQIKRLQRSSELRQRLSEKGRRYIVEKGLVWTETARRYAEIYREAAHPAAGTAA